MCCSRLGVTSAEQRWSFMNRRLTSRRVTSERSLWGHTCAGQCLSGFIDLLNKQQIDLNVAKIV